MTIFEDNDKTIIVSHDQWHQRCHRNQLEWNRQYCNCNAEFISGAGFSRFSSLRSTKALS